MQLYRFLTVAYVTSQAAFVAATSSTTSDIAMAIANGAAETTNTTVDMVTAIASGCLGWVEDVVNRTISSAQNISAQNIGTELQRISAKILGEEQQQLQVNLQRFEDVSRVRDSRRRRCPVGWSRHQDSCYFIPQRTATWYLAHHGCATVDRRARLASIHPNSSEFIKTLVTNFGAARGVWVGLVRNSDGYSWVWSDGTPLDYTDWDRGQPNDAFFIEDYVHLGWKWYTKTRWHDNRASTTLNFLCQINLD